MSLNPLHFLVADESKGVRTFMEHLLEGYGFDPSGIRSVSNPESALEEAVGFKPDFLVTDWFPNARLNGIELYKKVREESPSCRLALLSNEVTPRHQAEAIEVGSRFLLCKPFTAIQLKDEIKKALAALAFERPDLVARLSAVMAKPVAKTVARPATAIKPVHASAESARPAPPLVQLKPGDHVIYGTKEETVDYVVLRAGELVAHLKSNNSFVPVQKLRKM